MSIISTTVLAFSMSADAFAAAIGKGASLKKPRLRDAAAIGLIFGVVEAITPIIGWLAGVAASTLIASIDHWIAFIILAVIGAKMIAESLKKERAKEVRPHSLTALVFTAIGTSVDALAVGVTMAFLDMNIWLSALAIGTATFVMATLGIMTGHYIGSKGGRIAEAIGGLGLMIIGLSILIEHLL